MSKKERGMVLKSICDPATWERGHLESLMSMAFDDLTFVEGECESRVRFDFADGSSVWFDAHDVSGTLTKSKQHKISGLAKRLKLANEVSFV